jgi:hypothetical protein
MNEVIFLLFAFVLIGLAERRLGKGAYVAMGVAIVAYVVYAYNK